MMAAIRQTLLPRLPSLKEDVGEQVDKEIIFGGSLALLVVEPRICQLHAD